MQRTCSAQNVSIGGVAIIPYSTPTDCMIALSILLVSKMQSERCNQHILAPLPAVLPVVWSPGPSDRLVTRESASSKLSACMCNKSDKCC
jgi:hypothetical protein